MIQSLIYRVINKLVKIYWGFNYSVLRSKYEINKTFRFNGPHIQIYGDGSFLTGKNSYIGSFSTIQINRKSKVKIGNNCRISHNVRMYTQSIIPDQDFSDYNNLKSKSGDILIGDDVWIGANVFINPGISIGGNSVIGANSVVTKDVEPFAIMGGVPAKLIRYKNIGDKETF